MKIYVASSWRNTFQPDVVAALSREPDLMIKMASLVTDDLAMVRERLKQHEGWTA